MSQPNRWTVGGVVSALSVSVLGYNFLSNPEGFIVAAMLNWAIGAVTSFAGEVGLLFADLWGVLTGVVVDSGLAVVSPFGAGADGLLGLVATANEWLVDLAGIAGPAAPIVALLVWAVIAIALATVIERVVAGVAPWT